MTDRKTGSSPKKPAVRESRRHSPWPLVIVVALPIISFLLRLPLWVTLVLLLLGTVLLFFSPHLSEKSVSDPKKAWLQLLATFNRLQSVYAALRESPADAATRQRFATLEAECLALLNSRPDSDWGTDSGYVAKIRKEIAEMSAPDKVEGPGPAPSPEAVRLAELRKQGPMTDNEFHAFSDKLKVLAAEKAQGVLEAVAGFQLQYRQGALTEENLHAALWSLLGGLYHADGDAVPRPVTPAQPGQGAAGG